MGSGLRDQVAALFASMDRPVAWGPVGTVPSESDFSETIGRVLRNLDVAASDPIRTGELRWAYLSGYVDCACRGLLDLGWDLPLVGSAVSVLLSLAYLDRYLVYETDSWRRTVSKVLRRYFSEDFTDRFLDDMLNWVQINS